ncbi:hypothetical protein D3C81_1025810 [compost metagenome]
MRKFEGQFNKLRPDDLVEFAFTPFSIIQYGLIHHIPTKYPSFITGNNGLYMLPHAFDKYLSGDLFPIFIDKKPSWCLRMPNQRMTDNLHFIFFSKCDKAVRILKIELTFPWLQKHTFHTILGNYGVELRFDHRDRCLIALPYLIKV